MKNPGWDKKFKSFWLPLLSTKGKLSLKKISNEIHDFDFIIEQLPKVYSHITSGRLSKHMYHADTVIAEHDDHCHEYCVDADDHKMEIKEKDKELADVTQQRDDAFLYLKGSLNHLKRIQNDKGDVCDKLKTMASNLETFLSKYSVEKSQ